MIHAERIGIGEDTFWQLTPKQLDRRFEAARLRAVDRYREDVTLAWNISRVFFTSKGKKKLVPLKDLLTEVGDGAKSDRQSPQELRAMLGVLSQVHKIPLRKAKPHGG